MFYSLRMGRKNQNKSRFLKGCNNVRRCAIMISAFCRWMDDGIHMVRGGINDGRSKDFKKNPL